MNAIRFLLHCVSLPAIALAVAVCPLLAAAATLTANSPQTAAQAIAQAVAGDVVQLSPGNYGKLLLITGEHNQVAVGGAALRGQLRPLTGPATITSADPDNRAVLTGIENRDAPFWTFDRLQVVPNGNIQSIAIRIMAADNSLTGNRFGHPEYQGWTTAQWLAGAARMIYSTGARTQVLNNSFTGVFHGVILAYGADGSRAQGNVMRGLGGDAFNVSANNVQISGNDMAEFFAINGNHDDCLQIWAGPGVNQRGTNSGLTVTGNRCRVHTDLAYRPPGTAYPPMTAALQGYGGYDGLIADCTIRDNWGVLTAYHGVTFAGATNCIYDGNRVIHATGAKTVWIKPGRTKDGRLPSGNRIENNIANQIDETLAGATYAGNWEISPAGYDVAFVDWRHGDLRLTTTEPPPVPDLPPATLPDEPPPVVDVETPPTPESETPPDDRAALFATIREALDKLEGRD